MDLDLVQDLALQIQIFFVKQIQQILVEASHSKSAVQNHYPEIEVIILLSLVEIGL